MKENENGQTDPVKAVFNTVMEFCTSGELEECLNTGKIEPDNDINN